MWIRSCLLHAAPLFPSRYEQSWPAAVRTFPVWVLAKLVFNAIILNYAASSFIVSRAAGLEAAAWRILCCLSQPALQHAVLSGASLPCAGRPPLGCTRSHVRGVSLVPRPLQVLWLHDCLSIWRSVYFLGHISTLAIILVGMALPPRKPKRDESLKKEK